MSDQIVDVRARSMEEVVTVKAVGLSADAAPRPWLKYDMEGVREGDGSASRTGGISFRQEARKNRG
jgi:hypothetical protein